VGVQRPGGVVRPRSREDLLVLHVKTRPLEEQWLRGAAGAAAEERLGEVGRACARKKRGSAPVTPALGSDQDASTPGGCWALGTVLRTSRRPSPPHPSTHPPTSSIPSARTKMAVQQHGGHRCSGTSSHSCGDFCCPARGAGTGTAGTPHGVPGAGTEPGQGQRCRPTPSPPRRPGTVPSPLSPVCRPFPRGVLWPPVPAPCKKKEKTYQLTPLYQQSRNRDPVLPRTGGRKADREGRRH